MIVDHRQFPMSSSFPPESLPQFRWLLSPKMIKQGQLPPGPVPFLFPWLCLCLRSFRSNPASRSISRCDMNFASSQKVSLWPFLLLLPLKLQPPERIANTESLLHNLWHLQVIWLKWNLWNQCALLTCKWCKCSTLVMQGRRVDCHRQVIQAAFFSPLRVVSSKSM